MTTPAATPSPTTILGKDASAGAEGTGKDAGAAGAGDGGAAGAAGDGAGKTPAVGAGAGAKKPEGQDGATPEGAGAKAKDDAPGDLELKLPEGVVPDAEMIAGFKAIAKESGLKGEAAQKIVDLYVKAQQAAATKAAEGWEQQQQEWMKSIKEDKELGGANSKATEAAIAKVMTAYGTPELRELFESTGLGNHPELVRFAARIGKAMAEDSVARPTVTPAGGAAGEDPFTNIYTTMKPKE